MVYRYSWLAGAIALAFAFTGLSGLLRETRDGTRWQYIVIAALVLGATITQDWSISLAFYIDELLPGECVVKSFAYVLDIDRRFVDRYNHELIDIHRITPESMEAHLHHLRELILRHVELTGSAWGEAILDDYRTFLHKFWVVKPKAVELGSLIDALRRAA